MRLILRFFYEKQSPILVARYAWVYPPYIKLFSVYCAVINCVGHTTDIFITNVIGYGWCIASPKCQSCPKKLRYHHERGILATQPSRQHKAAPSTKHYYPEMIKQNSPPSLALIEAQVTENADGVQLVFQHSQPSVVSNILTSLPNRHYH